MPYGLGADVGSIQYLLADLGIPEPKGSFREHAEYRNLANGGVRGVGGPVATWHWDFFKMAWYDTLRAILTDVSGPITIETTINDNEDEFANFDCIYIWPLELDKDSHRRMDFNIVFRRCVDVTPPEE